MDTYALMKEDGAGTVAPGHFHPLCDPNNTLLANPAQLTAPFISGLLREKAGSDSAQIFAAGARAFVRPNLNGPRYVITGTGISDLADYDAWLAENVTDANLLKLFEQAWNLYPYGFYWVPSIHPRCFLYKKGNPRQLCMVRKNGKLYFKLLVQRHAAPAYIAERHSVGLQITGAISADVRYSTLIILDLVRFSAFDHWVALSEGLCEVQTYFNDRSYDENVMCPIYNATTGAAVSAAIAGDFGYPSGYTDPKLGTVMGGCLFMTADDIATMRKDLWPAGGATDLLVRRYINNPDDVQQTLIDDHGLTKTQVAEFFPTPDEAAEAFWPGTYTKTYSDGTTRSMVAIGYGHNKNLGSAATLENASGFPANPRTIEEVGLPYMTPMRTSKEAYNFYYVNNNGTVSGTGAALASVITPGDAGEVSTTDTAKRILAASFLGDLDTAAVVTLRLTTGLAEYFVESATIGIRISSMNMVSFSFPEGLELSSYDETEGIAWIAIDTEAVGLQTETSASTGQKIFVPLQDLTVTFSITRNGAPSGDAFTKIMLTTGGFQGGGSYGSGGATEVPALLTSWDSFTPPSSSTS